MYQLSRTIPVNEPGKVLLSRNEVWGGLMMKAQNALPYVPQMQKCDVIEQGEGWLLRDIVFNNTPLRERERCSIPKKPSSINASNLVSAE